MKILLATDGSEYSNDAARFLCNFRFTPKDQLTLFHVVSAIPYHDDYRAQVMQAIKRVSPKILGYCRDALKNVQASIVSDEGQGVPETEIIRRAEDIDADLIVMGARGVKGLSSLFLGSVTRAVAAASSRPILVTKLLPWKSDSRLKVLFCTDGSASADATAEILAGLPFREDTELTILSIAWSAFADIPERFAMEVNEAMKDSLAKIRTAESEAAEKIIDRTKALLSGRFQTIHALIKGGDPADEILKQVKDMRADLVAVGSRGQKGIKGMLGSVSRRVLGRADCNVLIGRTKA